MTDRKQTTDDQVAEWRSFAETRRDVWRDPSSAQVVHVILDTLDYERQRADVMERNWRETQDRCALEARERDAAYRTLATLRAGHNADGLRWVGFPRADKQETYCTRCGQVAPCETVRTIDGIEA